MMIQVCIPTRERGNEEVNHQAIMGSRHSREGLPRHSRASGNPLSDVPILKLKAQAMVVFMDRYDTQTLKRIN